MSGPTILITGASGQLGALALASLRRLAPDARILGLVRRADAAAALTAQGFEARIADYTDTEALAAAMEGVDRVLLISSSEVGQRFAQHGNVVKAAQAAGVGLIVYTSILQADSSEMALATEHRQTEALIAASGLPHVFLRNGWYSENHVMSVGAALQHGALAGAAGDGRFSTASRADYAEAAAVVLAGDAVVPGTVLELAGDDSFTLAEYAAELSRLAGRTIPYADMPEADYAAMLEGAGVPGPMAGILADSDAHAAQGALEENGKALSRLIGRPTTPWQETLAQAVKAMETA